MRRFLVGLGLSCAALSSVPVDHGGTVWNRGCEPGEPVEIHARVASIGHDHGLATVAVDITVSSAVELAAVGLRGRLTGARDGVAADLDLPIGVVPGVSPRTSRHLLTMEDGRDHDLLLTLHALPRGGPARTAAAWLPISLDPARRPRDAGGVLEYRAQSGWEQEP